MDWRSYFPRPVALGLTLLLLSGSILVLEQPWRAHSSVPPPPADLPASELQYPAAADFRGATGWVGTPNGTPLYLEDLRGQVVLIDFWTYSCINCIHTFPHVEAWYQRYKDDGFLILGVHTPEFRFEHDAVNVQAARERYGLTYPTAQDNDYSIWSAYANNYWPAEYLIDRWGRVRHTHFGEGDYGETEDEIRQLLTEAGHDPGPSKVEPLGAESSSSHSPELYASEAEGSSRVSIANPEGYHPGQNITYARPSNQDPDLIYLVGTWENREEDVVAATDASVLVVFHGAGGNVVADGPWGMCTTVLLDGAPIRADRAGVDVNTSVMPPCMRLDGPRSYDFYGGPTGTHTVEMRVPPGFALFTFDFSSVAKST